MGRGIYRFETISMSCGEYRKVPEPEEVMVDKDVSGWKTMSFCLLMKERWKLQRLDVNKGEIEC